MWLFSNYRLRWRAPVYSTTYTSTITRRWPINLDSVWPRRRRRPLEAASVVRTRRARAWRRRAALHPKNMVRHQLRILTVFLLEKKKTTLVFSKVSLLTTSFRPFVRVETTKDLADFLLKTFVDSSFIARFWWFYHFQVQKARCTSFLD